MVPINWNPGAREVRSFSRLWFPLFVAMIGSVLRWRFHLPDAALWAWGLGALAVVAALVDRRVARAVFVGLMVVTYPIGLVVSTVALALLFYLVFAPLGWGMRLAGRDPLRLRTRDDVSQWQPVKQDEDVKRMFRQF
jgi:Saxitoxin biosynthesis operon protein SxtJ